MNRPAVLEALAALTPPQGTAFGLLLADYALAAIEPLDHERARFMSASMARDHLFVPRIEPLVTRWWRTLLGLPDEPEPPAEGRASVSHHFPEGSLARRFSEFHLDTSGVLLPGDSKDLYLQRLAMTSNDPMVGSAILVVEIAGDIVQRGPRDGASVLSDIDYALDEFYEAAGRPDQADAHALHAASVAAGFDGSPERAASARALARERGRQTFAAGRATP